MTLSLSDLIHIAEEGRSLRAEETNLRRRLRKAGLRLHVDRRGAYTICDAHSTQPLDGFDNVSRETALSWHKVSS